MAMIQVQEKNFKEGIIMRHVYIRSILALIWLAAAAVSGVSGNLEMAAFYVLICGVCGYSAYAVWKKEREGKGDRRDG